jgi:hypothetical protein
MAEDKGAAQAENTPKTVSEGAAAMLGIVGLFDGVEDEETVAGDAPAKEKSETDDQRDPDGLYDEGDEPVKEDAEAEDAEAGIDEDADEDVVEATQPEPTITIDEDGKKVVLTAKEVKERGLRHADYTRKTMAVAEERKATEAEKAAAANEKKVYGELVTTYRKHLDTILKNEPDWQRLKDEDPQQYLLVRDEWHAAQAERDAAKGEEDRLAEEKRQADAKAYGTFLEGEAVKLLDALPAWKNKDVALREGAAIRGFLRRRGLEDREITTVLSDHRSVLIVRDAALYDQRQRQDKTKIRPAKPKEKTLRPGANIPAATGEKAGMRAASQRLKQTGHVRDAADVFERMPGLLDGGKK